MNPIEASILWRALDRSGHDAASLRRQDAGWRLEGSAVFVHDARPYRLDYLVVCDAAWQTVSARVQGWAGKDAVEFALAADAGRRWRLNGEDRAEVAGCIDVDLGFSPCTNLLPIRRLNLQIGQEAAVRAAWLGFPEFAFEPLEQRYRRSGALTYGYETASGFSTTLAVNAAGFITVYPGLWQAETGM